MWSNGGGVADNLSREFRAMSSERDRRWGIRGGIDSGSCGSRDKGFLLYGGGTCRDRSSPLRYGSTEWRSREAYEGYQPIRRYSQNEVVQGWRGGGGGDDEGYAARPTTQRGAAAPTRASPYGTSSRGRGRTASKRRGRRDSDEEDDEDSYSYSYSYTSSTSQSTESVSSEERNGERRGTRRQDRRSAKPPLRARGGGKGQAPRPVRYTPTGPIGAAHAAKAEGAAVHWVGDEDGDDKYAVDGLNGRTVVTNPTLPQMSPQMPALQPSVLLRRVVEAVSYYRGVQTPATIPSEVTLAFDEYVSRGSTMLKFVPHGPPHSRYFNIRFLDVLPGGGRRRLHSRAGTLHEVAMPYAVLAWYRNTSSRHMIRFLPLHDLMEVKADGADHPYVQRRTVQPGMLRGPRTGLSTNYVYAEYILQFRFRSRLSHGEETLALKTANRTQHLAWMVVGLFISQVGAGGINQFR